MALINKAVRMATPVKLDTADVYAEVARRVAHRATTRDPGAAFKSMGLDHKEAYRQLRARNDRLCRCVVAEDPSTGRVRFFRMERLSFGDAAAVVHYNAIAKVLARVGRRGLKLPLCQYYDDFASPCPANDDTALTDVLELLQGILHTSFNEDKTSEGHSFRHLGLVFTITSEGVGVPISAPRREGLVHMLKGVLARDSLSPGEAASLAGKLGFTTVGQDSGGGRAVLSENRAAEPDTAGRGNPIRAPYGRVPLRLGRDDGHDNRWGCRSDRVLLAPRSQEGAGLKIHHLWP
ncbi:hypothetical protein DIPPA_31240 [Diplonema papillatum]|nr:hypothetical protein DIPPA_31240 [Diplonema papillatum]